MKVDIVKTNIVVTLELNEEEAKILKTIVGSVSAPGIGPTQSISTFVNSLYGELEGFETGKYQRFCTQNMNFRFDEDEDED